jgi:hypothetical protein
MADTSRDERTTAAVDDATGGQSGGRAAPNTPPNTPPNMPLFYALLAGAVGVAVALLIAFPNLVSNPGYLALVLLTPLLGGATIALMVSGAQRRLPGQTATIVRGALAVVVVLDLAAFALPIFIGGQTGHDTAPTFMTPVAHATQSAASATATPALATFSGQFDPHSGSHGDSVSGTAILGVTADGSAVLRLQNLNATNGPDLYVYLSTVASPSTNAQVMNGLEVSKLKATSGDSNYTLPGGTDITQFKAVAVYCKSFSTLFGYANLT